MAMIPAKGTHAQVQVQTVQAQAQLGPCKLPGSLRERRMVQAGGEIGEGLTANVNCLAVVLWPSSVLTNIPRPASLSRHSGTWSGCLSDCLPAAPSIIRGQGLVASDAGDGALPELDVCAASPDNQPISPLPMIMTMAMTMTDHAIGCEPSSVALSQRRTTPPV